MVAKGYKCVLFVHGYRGKEITIFIQNSFSTNGLEGMTGYVRVMEYSNKGEKWVKYILKIYLIKFLKIIFKKQYSDVLKK